MFSNKCFSSHVLIVMLLIGTAVIYAQNNEDYIDYGESGEELVITAGRTGEAAKSVPAQVTIITADDIAQSGAASVVDVLETVLGVRFSGGTAGAGSEKIDMRGFGENSYGRVLILVDGNKINDPDMNAINWNTIPLANIERIEILDGSASVLYGNNAVGGVINIITKKGGKRQTAISTAAGSFFNNREALSHFQPLSWGNFFVSAEHSGTQGYRQRQAAEAVILTGSSTVFIGDTMRFSFNGFFSRLYYQLPGGLTKNQFEEDPIQAVNRHDENTEYHFGGGFSFRWFPTEKTELTLPLSYRGKIIKSDMASYPTFTDRTVHSAEARPQGSVTFDVAGMPLRLLGGVDLYFVRLNTDGYNDENRTSLSNSLTITEWTIGPYLTARFSPLSNLFLSAGIRFDTAIIKADNPTGSGSGDKMYHALVYDAGIAFNPADELKLYTRYAALFRYPFVDELADTWSGFTSGLKPEKGFNAEIGASWRLKDILNLTANFFFMLLKDEINFDPDFFVNTNLDTTRRLGTNVGLSFTPIDWFSLNGSYSFVNAVFIDGPFRNKRVPLVPEHKIYGNIMIHLPFGLSFGPDLEYGSKRYGGGDFDNAGDVANAYFLLGAQMRFVPNKENNRFALQVTAKNLLDTHYAANVYYGTFYPADGLSINVSMQYRF